MTLFVTSVSFYHLFHLVIDNFCRFVYVPHETCSRSERFGEGYTLAKLPDDERKVWRNRIVRSAQQKRNLVREWQYIHELYKGNYEQFSAYKDRVSANYVLANVRQMTASLYAQPPHLMGIPVGHDSDVPAYVAEQVMDYERRNIDCDVEEEDAIKNALLYGTGILKHGYNFQSGVEIPWAKNSSVDAHEGNSTVSDDDSIPARGPLAEWNPRYKYGHAWVRSIHPVDFFIDPDCVRPAEARWMAHRYRRPWVDVVRDSRFDAKVRKGLAPSGMSLAAGDMDVVGEDWFNSSDGRDTAMVSLYEIFDRTTQSIILLTDTGECLMYEPYTVFGADGCYEIIQFLPVDDGFWGMSWVESFLPQVLAGNKLRTQMMDHFMRFGQVKGAYDKMSVEQSEMDAFSNNPTAAFIGMNLRNQGKITDRIQVFPYIPIPSDVWPLLDRWMWDGDQVSGLSELARGTGKSINTATEASYVQQQAGVRTASMQNKVNKFLRNSARKVHKLLKQFWGPERVYRIAGPDGLTWQYMQITNEMINAAYEIDIEPGSTELQNKAVRTRQIIDGMSTLAPMVPYVQQQGYDLNWVELMKSYLRSIDITKAPDRMMVPYQQMMQPGMAQTGAGGGGYDASGQMSQVPQPDNVVQYPGQQQMPMQSDSGQMGMTQSQMFTTGVPGGA